VQGVELERRYRRPVLSGLHAAHPIGMLAGGLAGVGAAAAELSILPHFALAAGAGLVGGLAATRWLVAEPRQPRRTRLARPTGRLLLLGVVAFCAFLLDGAANNWSAAQLHSDRGAGQALAAAGFTAFTAALGLGRLAGDRLVARFGRARVVRAGALVAAAGGTIAVAGPTALPTVAGWAVLGAGLAGWRRPSSAQRQAWVGRRRRSPSPASPRSAIWGRSPVRRSSAPSPRLRACRARSACWSPPRC
jgi:hypothetical protein